MQKRTAGGGAEALRVIAHEPPDLILLDVMMPDVDGLEVCRILKQDPQTRLIPMVFVTSLDDTASRIRGIDAGGDDFVSKPFNAIELRARVTSLLRIKSYTDELENAESIIVSLALTVEARDKTTVGHCERLAHYGSTLGRCIGLEEADVSALWRGGFLHDVGKIGVPDAILLKPGPLTRDETAAMKEHTVIGDGICRGLRSWRRVHPIVRHHHERLDGSGYPDGLRGDAIPLLAQIIGIVDVFDALSSTRPYKPAMSTASAIEELRNEVALGWRHADLVSVFIEQVERAAPGGGPRRCPGPARS